MKNLQQKVAVITGAANGIGKAMAIALAKENCHLALLDIDAQGLQGIKKQLTSSFSNNVKIYPVDIAQANLVEKIAKQIKADFTKIHLLINCAGVAINQPFEKQQLADFHWLMNINFWGTIYACKFFLPYLQQSNEAHIVNILSEFALNGFPAKTAYTASKAGLLGFSNSLYTELYGSSVGLSIILPGPVKTDLALKGKSQTIALAKKEDDFLAKTGISADKVAQKTIKAIKKKQQRMRIGFMAYLMDYVVRIAPNLAHQMIARWKHSIAFLE